VPYTISHIAAVIPVHRALSRAHLFSAAVIGSMVPDFGLLLPDPLSRWQTHSLPALLHFCLPVGLCTYALMQWLIKPAVLEVLPDGPYTRLRAEPPAPLASLRYWLWVAAALLLGALTHLVWDAFTHEDSLGVRMFPVLSDYSLGVARHAMRLYAWLQLLSSIVGLAVVMAALALWLRHSPAPATPPPRRLGWPERTAWSMLYLLPPLASTSWTLLQVASGHASRYSGVSLSGAAVDSLRGAALSLVLVSGLLLLRLRMR
jgi:Domain of unknown function (DUF4184)